MPDHNIQVDSQVFAFLQRHARPLVDTPNDVLRRLLITPTDAADHKHSEAAMPNLAGARASGATAGQFVREMLAIAFGAGLRTRAPYRMMFESEKVLVYCQNFNKSSTHLWYRITENPWKDLRTSGKEAFICFTNPAERFAYIVPVIEVEAWVHKSTWTRSYLEVNIDPATSRWIELQQDLTRFRKVV